MALTKVPVPETYETSVTSGCQVEIFHFYTDKVQFNITNNYNRVTTNT